MFPSSHWATAWYNIMTIAKVLLNTSRVKEGIFWQSTVCAKIMELLGQNKVDHRQRKVAIISQDSFYKVLTPDQKAKALKGQYNFDHPGMPGIFSLSSFWTSAVTHCSISILLESDKQWMFWNCASGNNVGQCIFYLCSCNFVVILQQQLYF